MVRLVVRGGIECSEPVMFWQAEDQEICMLAWAARKIPDTSPPSTRIASAITPAAVALFIALY